jgi:hypothetical protein
MIQLVCVPVHKHNCLVHQNKDKNKRKGIGLRSITIVDPYLTAILQSVTRRSILHFEGHSSSSLPKPQPNQACVKSETTKRTYRRGAGAAIVNRKTGKAKNGGFFGGSLLSSWFLSEKPTGMIDIVSYNPIQGVRTLRIGLSSGVFGVKERDIPSSTETAWFPQPPKLKKPELTIQLLILHCP